MAQAALLDDHGNEIVNYGQRRDFRKSPAPITGNAFGDWAGRDLSFLRMPGGGVLQFDLSRLTLQDYRTMRTHYQINASMMILMFMMHNLDWHIECSVPKIAEQIESNLRDVWTRLIRGISQAYWAGFSPCVLEFDNDPNSGYIELKKVKDLLPEDCHVNWKYVEGYAPPGHTPPKFREFDGIKQFSNSWPVPAENSLWYPLLMENGDYWGRKLLKPSFPSWFFSQLIHLFANRYYERFGEPLPIGRAPFEDQVDLGGGDMVSGKNAIETILMNLRNRSVVALPSDRDANNQFEYDIEYLESQMRGADFERYLSRLDEEMALSVFTPVLLFRTADVGSYNLGTQHLQLYQWCLSALSGDLGEYIERYPVARLHDYNFGPNAPKAYFRFRSQAKDNDQILNTLVEFTLRGNNAVPDLEELGRAVGISFNEVQQLMAVPAGATVDPKTQEAQPPPGPAGSGTDQVSGRGYRRPEQVDAVTRQIASRFTTQIEKAWRDGTFGLGKRPTLGYRGRFEDTLIGEGYERTLAKRITDDVYGAMDAFIADTWALGRREYSNPADYMALVARALDVKTGELPAPAVPIKG